MNNLQSAARHLYLRWTGVLFLFSGALLLGLALRSISLGAPFWIFLLAIASCGLSLGSFGINHDTGIAYAFAAHQEGVSFDNHQLVELELKEDLAHNRAETMGLKPHQILSYVIPLLTVFLHLYLWSWIKTILESV
jgi:hypothetical protein